MNLVVIGILVAVICYGIGVLWFCKRVFNETTAWDHKSPASPSYSNPVIVSGIAALVWPLFISQMLVGRTRHDHSDM